MIKKIGYNVQVSIERSGVGRAERERREKARERDEAEWGRQRRVPQYK